MAISHADCTHPRTPAGRRACRAGRNFTPETNASIDRVVAALDAAFRTAKVTTDPVKITGAARAARLQAMMEPVVRRRS